MPLRRRSSLSSVRTAPRVPTGMNAGVATPRPDAVTARPARAARSVASMLSVTGTSGPLDEHGVAEGQEPVALTQCDGIEVAPARTDERLHHREQCGAGQMEVRQQHVDRTEFEAWANEECRAPRRLAGRGDRLEGAHHGGADGHHAL